MPNVGSLSNAQKMLADLKKKYRYAKNNQARAQAADLQYDLMKCRGELELSKKELDRAIRTQSQNIVAGKKTGANTLIQEQMLWDAAIAYMLVKDAIYAMTTISTHDSISYAYEMLDKAANQMTGKKKNKFFKLPQVRAARSRDGYSYITSEEALTQKEQLLEQFFETLKETGNIEDCLETVKHPGEIAAERAEAYTQGGAVPQPNGGTADEYDARLAKLQTEKPKADFSNLNIGMNIHPAAPAKTAPKAEEEKPQE